MVYITEQQYKMISSKFMVEEIVDRNLFNGCSLLESDYDCDHILVLSNDNNKAAIVLEFNFDNLNIYVLDIVDPGVEYMFDLLTTKRCEILEKNVFQRLLYIEDKDFCLFDSTIQNIVMDSQKEMMFHKVISCSEFCNLRIWSKEEISTEQINDYLIPFEISDRHEYMDIYSVDNETNYYIVQRLFNTMQYLHQIRLAMKPEVISEGNGFVFFETGMYMVGVHKYYNYADSDLIYYICERNTKISYIFSVGQPQQQVLRAGQAYLAYTNKLLNGINLHASALTYNDKAILLVGSKGSGKTTNALFGLKYYKDMCLMSNDFVYLYCRNQELYAIGSRKKMTIRPRTVNFFDEFQKDSTTFHMYDSVGKAANKQLVRKIEDIAKLFQCKTQYFSQAAILVEIVYNKDVENLDITELDDKDVERLLIMHSHTNYNATEKFWDDVLGTVDTDYTRFKGLRAVRLVINEKNIQQTWGKIRDFLDHSW